MDCTATEHVTWGDVDGLPAGWIRDEGTDNILHLTGVIPTGTNADPVPLVIHATKADGAAGVKHFKVSAVPFDQTVQVVVNTNNGRQEYIVNLRHSFTPFTKDAGKVIITLSNANHAQTGITTDDRITVATQVGVVPERITRDTYFGDIVNLTKRDRPVVESGKIVVSVIVLVNPHNVTVDLIEVNVE